MENNNQFIQNNLENQPIQQPVPQTSQEPSPATAVANNTTLIRKLLMMFLGIFLGLFAFLTLLIFLNYFNIISLAKPSRFFAFLPKKAVLNDISKNKITPSLSPFVVKKMPEIDYNLVTTKLATIPKEYKIDDNFLSDCYFSQDGKRVAYIVFDYPKDVPYVQVLYVDSKKINSSWKIESFKFSPDGKKYSYSLSTDYDSPKLFLDESEIQPTKKYLTKGLIFSPDNKNILYSYLFKPYHDWTKPAETYKPEAYITYKGKESKHYASLEEYSLTISPDGNKVAFIGINASPSVESVVVNGEEQKSYKSYETHPVFSPDSEKVAYLVDDEKFLYLVVNGKEIKKYDKSLGYSVSSSLVKFSPDSQKIAYILTQNSKEFLVVDGKESPRFDQIINFVFSPDSKSIVLVSLEKKYKTHLLVNNVAIKDFVSYDVVFSPDSKKTAYFEAEGLEAATSSTELTDVKLYLNVGGQRFPLYLMLSEFTFANLKFSPDNNNVAYVGNNDTTIIDTAFNKSYVKQNPNKKYFIAINGKKGKEYDQIFDYKFTPDGKKIMYGARLDHELWWIVDPI